MNFLVFDIASFYAVAYSIILLIVLACIAVPVITVLLAKKAAKIKIEEHEAKSKVE